MKNRRGAVGRPNEQKMKSAERVNAASRMVDRDFGIESRLADLRNTLDKVSIFSKHQTFVKTADRPKRVCAHDDTFSGPRADVKYVIHHSDDEIVDFEYKDVRKFPLRGDDPLRCNERQKRSIFETFTYALDKRVHIGYE